MKQERLRAWGVFILVVTCVSLAPIVASAQSRAGSGKLTGLVHDMSGVPQMGAAVELVPEIAVKAVSLGLTTNTQGIFRGDHLNPGLYTVRVTLAGFLPTVQQHVRVTAHLTTVVRVELESMFTSLDQLRHQPSTATVANDDWKWVLRSASITRPVLQWTDDDSTVANDVSWDARSVRPRAMLEFTDGSRRPGSSSNIPAAPGTAFAYDQKIGGPARLLLAGQMNYESQISGGGIATVWLPTGSMATGPHSALVVRESKLGPDGPTFRGVRLEQGGAVAIGDHTVLSYGAEYVLVGMLKSASSIRPRLQLQTEPVDGWRTALVFAEEPGAPTPLEANERENAAELAAAMDELDSFPTMLLRNGRPVLEGGWHEELSAEHKLSSRTTMHVAAFHDDNRHVAVFGRGNDLPAEDFIQDYFSNGFAYDGGSSGSWGMRLAVREQLPGNTEVTAVYAYAGALSPSELADSTRASLRKGMYHSVAANVSTKLPRVATKLNVGYKWVSGDVVSRVDSYGESLFQTEPFLHIGVKQALPKFAPGHWEAIANCDNLLAQGYVTVNMQDGRAVLVPTFRSFRGGVSVQF